MKTFNIMRATTRYEREKGLVKEDSLWVKVLSCPTALDAEKLVKAIEKHTMISNLMVEQTGVN